MYNIDNKLIHNVSYYDKTRKFTSFYFDKYKKITMDTLAKLPFDTNHFITYEIIGYSVFAVSINKEIYLFNKYKKYDQKLNKYINDDYKLRYLINKYNNYTLEFKLFNNELFLVNIFNDKKIKDYRFIKNISETYEIKIPKLVDSNLHKFGNGMMDIFYDDYYLNNNIFVKDRNYYLTFIFKNNKYLLYKL